VENISLFTEAINRQMRQQWDGMSVSILQTDLTLTVAKLGKNLFRELKLLEPYGMGNPVPKLRIENCWFERVWHRNLQDWQGQKLRYIKTEFELWDDSVSAGFPGVWWEHYRDEVPTGRCDAVVELDYNPGQKRYEVRLIAVRPVPAESVSRVAPAVEGLLDWRTTPPPTQSLPQESDDILAITTCPSSWEELQSWIDQAHQSQRRLALAYPPPTDTAPLDLWQRLVGIAKSLNQTGKLVTSVQLSQTLGITDRSLQVGLNSLQQLGLTVMTTAQGLRVQASAAVVTSNTEAQARQAFLAAVHEEQFQQRYFYQMPLTTLQALATQTLKTGDNKNCKGT
jgi:single-stranded-DNA-specific exonuclease